MGLLFLKKGVEDADVSSLPWFSEAVTKRPLRPIVERMRTVFCAKLKKDAPGLERKPYPNELGERIYEQVSKEAWQEWLEHSKRLVNEGRWDLQSSKAKTYFLEQAEAFFFGDGGAVAEGYVPESKS